MKNLYEKNRFYYDVDLTVIEYSINCRILNGAVR